MTHTQLPFFGREAELQLMHSAWRAATDATTRTPQIITFIAESGVGKSRIIQQFYHQLTNSTIWDPDNFWPNAFQVPSTQLRVNPEFPADFNPNGPPRFLWLGMRWTNAEIRNAANSLVLPSLKEQILTLNKQTIQFQSRWTRMAQSLKKSSQDIIRAEEIFKIVAGNLVPFADVAITILSPLVKEGLDHTETTPTLSDQLFELLYTWFSQPTPIPLIIWLDDVQWIDTEARAFFTRLMHTARNRHWGILLLATCWPKEWFDFDEQFFLKHDTATVQHLGNTSLAELRGLLRESYPHLPSHQINLLISKAGGNFLTMIENIAELRSNSHYFINNDFQQPLSTTGENAIKTWESQRENHIKQRFGTFNQDIQDFLARASQAGMNAQFLHNVLVRYSSNHPYVGNVTSLLQQTQLALAVVMPLSPNIHEFRDRGYFAVAQRYFSQWLLQNESEPLREALIVELTAQVQSAFDNNHELCNPIHHPTSLRSAPIREQHTILELACEQLPTHTTQWVQALVARCLLLIESYAWGELRSHMHTIAIIDWKTHIPDSIGWQTLQKLADVCRESGAIAQATDIYDALLDYHRMCLQQSNTIHNHHQLVRAYINLGKILVDRSDFQTAKQTYQEASKLVQSLLNQPQSDHASKWENIRLQSDILHYMGDIHLRQSQFTTALAYFEEDLALSRTLAQERHHIDDIRDLSIAYVTIGNCAMAMGNIAHARDCYRESSELKQQIIEKRGTPEDYRILAVTLSRLGRSYLELGALDDALHTYQTTLITAKRVIQSRSLLDDQRTYTTALNNVGRIYLKQGNLAAARELVQESLTVSRQIVELRGLTLDHTRLTTTLFLMGHIVQKYANYSDALHLFTEAMTRANHLVTLLDVPDTRLDVIMAHNFVGECHMHLGDNHQALASLQEAHEIWQQHALRHIPKFIRQKISINNNLGSLFLSVGDDQQAETYFQDSRNACMQLVTSQNMPINKIIQLQTDSYFGTIVAYRGQALSAITLYHDIITRYQQLAELTYPAEIQYDIASIYYELSTLYYHQHDVKQAVNCAQQAILCIMQDAYQQTKHVSTSIEKLNTWLRIITQDEKGAK